MTANKITSVLGLDYGTSRIGVATGQTITGTSTPLTTLKQLNGLPDWAGLRQLVEKWNPGALIVGMPYHVDGSESDMTRTVRDFCAQLEQQFPIPVYPVNETLSSREAEERLKKNIKIGKHNKHEVDKMAAAIIVQSWLDQQ